jgi:hypothetical protein
MNGAAPPPCWIPERIVTGNAGDERCRWNDVAGVRFTDPFFDDTVRRWRQDSQAERWSTADELFHEAATVPAVDDVVFIFHVSRCGSTLLSQLFGLDEGTLVLSEVPLLDTILRTGGGDRERRFDAALRLLGRPRGGVDPRFVVKTDCWHLFDVGALRRLYPQARFVLLYRRPAAVLGSHQKMRGMQMVPGMLDTLHVPYDPEKLNLDQYGAIVLERLYATMLDVAAADERSLLASYEEGFPAVFLRVAEWLGLSFDPERLAQIHERCGYHAKRPHETFGTETLPPLSGVDLAPLDALFAALEQRRTGIPQPSSPT